ncbi:MAG TPA: hypothetical protein VLX92_34230 [Kofleriaceae bacterium]|nr:hypothetical protein [Kofleriaceae bacterium]
MDRQDIDALLIGALYGELTPADEARLAAHLESHPADRTALEDLKLARQAVRDSAVLAVQLEPPQAVSAMLLQEAHRRAPRRAPDPGENEGWFSRLSRAFFAHPAMAAAAMLVVVVGVAGTLYLKSGGTEFAEKSLDRGITSGSAALALPAPPAPPAAAPAPAATPAPERWHGNDQATASGSGAAFETGSAVDSYRVGLASNGDYKGDGKDGDALHAGKKESPAPAHHASGLEVRHRDPEPKDLPADNERQEVATEASADDRAPGAGGAAAGPVVTGAAAPPSGGFASPPEPTSPASRTIEAPRSQAAPPPPPPAPAPKALDKSKVADAPVQQQDSSLVAWAKAQHDRAKALAKEKDRCNDVAAIVLAINDRAPSYYADNVAADPALKYCAAYYRDTAEREIARRKAKAAQKSSNASDERAAPPTASPAQEPAHATSKPTSTGK